MRWQECRPVSLALIQRYWTSYFRVAMRWTLSLILSFSNSVLLGFSLSLSSLSITQWVYLEVGKAFVRVILSLSLSWLFKREIIANCMVSRGTGLIWDRFRYGETEIDRSIAEQEALHFYGLDRATSWSIRLLNLVDVREAGNRIPVNCSLLLLVVH